MEHVRILATELAFEGFLYDHHLVLPDRDREYLQDVCILLHGSPRYVNPASISAPADIRLYLDGVEVTAAYVAEMRAVLDQQPADVLRAQYDRALQGWIKLAEGLGVAYGFDIAKDKADRERLLAVEPFSALVDRLGNLSAGNAGFLHVFNFVHTLIDLPPISIANVARWANDAAGEMVVDLTTISRLSVSNGPCRLFVEDWQPPRSVGALVLQVEGRYHDPLADRLAELEKRVEEIESFLASELAEILDRLSLDGPIARSVASGRESLVKAQTALAAVQGEMRSQTAQLAGLEATCKDLKNAVDAL